MFALLLLSCLAAFQGDEPELSQEFTFRYVRLDIMAFDKKGNPVTDLEPSDFVIKENRKKVKPDSFIILDYDKQTTIELDMETFEPIDREQESEQKLVSQYILALDLESARFLEVKRTFSELEQFLEGFEPEREVRIMLYSMEHGRLGDDGFTDDIGLVQKTLASYKARIMERMQDTVTTSSTARTGRYDDNQPLGLEQYVTDNGRLNRDIDELETKFIQCRNLLEPTDPQRRLDLKICLDEELQAFLDLQYERVTRTIGELEALANEFDDIPGLKNMLFVSPGFSLNPGQSAVLLAEHFRNHATSDLDLYKKRPQVRNEEIDLAMAEMGTGTSIRPESFEKEFLTVVNACARNRVIFNTFDIFNYNREIDRHHNVEHDYKAPTRIMREAHRQYGAEMKEGMHRLADESGGRFSSGVSLATPMKSLFNERQFFYVLGYESPEGKPGKYRRIKVKCKRRGVTLRYRKGYLGS